MFRVDEAQLEFISRATIELSHAMGRMAKVGPSVAFVGSNRLTRTSKNKHYFEQAVEIAKTLGFEGWAIITGGGAGINEAAIIGAKQGRTRSVGIRLIPTEFKSVERPDVRIKVTNPFNRKVLLDIFSDAYVFFPGGIGTLDILFEILTLHQTRRIERKPIICVGKSFWQNLLDPLFKTCLKKKFATISPQDVNLMHFTDSPQEVAEIIRKHRGEVLRTKGALGLSVARSASSQWSQSFAHRAAMELITAFNCFHGIGDGITVFGSSRTKPDADVYYETLLLAQELGKSLVKRSKKRRLKGAIITGGGPGSMEAANKGARLGGAPSLGLGIDIPMEQGFNPYVDPPLSFEFKFFFCRKWVFSVLTDILIATPGGFGTFDELFEMVAIKQLNLKKNPNVAIRSIYCVNQDFWQEPLSHTFEVLLSNGFIPKEHQKLIHFKWDTEEAISEIKKELEK